MLSLLKKIKHKLLSISFAENSFDAVVFLDAVLPDKQIILSAGSRIFKIAADGAGNKMIMLGIVPDAIVGDLDSIDKKILDRALEGVEKVLEPDQNKNDFEKALDYAASKNFKRILIMGFHGGELEHTLNNWSVMAKYSAQFELCIYDSERYGFLIDTSVRFTTYKDEIISIIPFPSAVIKTTGLQWELNNELLELGIREGARNRAKANNVEIIMNKGRYMLFLDSRLPYAPSFKRQS